MADEEMAIAAMDAASALDAGVRVEEENRSAGGDEDAAVNTWDDSEDQASDGVADNHEEMPNRSTDVPMADDMEASSGAEDADNVLDGSNPLVMGLVPTTKTFDRHVKVLVHNPDRNLYFDQWKRKLNNKSTVKRLRMSFEELLPRLMGARDYAGAAKVLEVMYHRFTVTPALCIEASLEILRRQPNYRNDLLSFYEAALNVERIDKVLILKEMWLFHIVHGEFYEAYHLYQDKIEQLEEVENDARLLANFGILCYWLMFVESKELRDMLKREDMENEEDEDEELNAADATGFYASESIESVIESNYLFKTPIGVHILYQHACNALRRAVALSPNSAMFVEYYVQLLVLVGDIQPACDYLEAFYHMNPEDPHGPRMLGRFLGCYYPDSVDAQIAVLSRWMKDDPTCSYPLEKMLELSSAGAVSSFVLTKVLVDALDTCGSDLYVAQNPNVSLALWRNLAELLAAMDEGDFLLDQFDGGVTDPSNQVTLADVGAQHSWWKRVYFARPSTVQEVAAISKRDGTFMEVSIYRAAVADRLFPGHLQMTEALRTAMVLPEVAFSHEHVRLFKSFFPSISRMTANMAVHAPFHAMPFTHVIVEEDNNQKDPPLPVFKGSSDTMRVIDRKSIVEREAAGEKTEVVVTREGGTEDVDARFLEELYEALELEVGHSKASDKRSQRKRKADDISTSTPELIPAFVGMVEEEVFNKPDASLPHIYSTIYQKLRRTDMLVPTSKVVAHCVDFFRRRLKDGGLLIRYEEFIIPFMRRQRDKGMFEISTDVAKRAIEEMKRVWPSPPPHVPDEKLVQEAMRRKAPMLSRERRLQLLELKKTLQPVLRELVYVEEKKFVDVVYSVCKQNGLLGVLNRFDIAHAVQTMLPMHYFRVLQSVPSYLLEIITSPTFRMDCNTVEEILEKLKTKVKRSPTEEVKTLLWVEKYEALYGPIIGDENESGSSSDTGSDSEP
ncbi:hypothetical protein PC121_g2742 [Phytophthora cactorum]|nr:hypothetical protein PC120_g4674 [Phytophthora cactorum]KAG3095467.1 hypothetical protein PC121_g2742 [Phytophthora cactorum]KAG4060212.1 hypothetical protein PC123_g4880 [Phytophthora cactorum]